MRTALLSIIIALPTVGAARAQSVSSNELSSRAEKILSKNCFSCHGNDAKQAQAGLKILDIKDMVARNILRSKSPDDSELISRVEDGTMPPLGRDGLSKDERDVLRAWVQAGTPAFPDKLVGSTYVLQQIQDDLKKIPSDDRPSVRYFSLNHLRAEKTDEELEEYRSALNTAVAFLSRLPTNQVKPLPIDDKTGTIFRINLRHHGWEKSPYENNALNFWDLILLEYPYAVVDSAAPSFQKLAEDFLVPAGQVRPVTYVRADWFVWLATVAAFTNDFRQVPTDERVADPAVDPALVEIASRYANGRVTLAGAVAELGSIRTESELRSVLESAAFARNGVHALAAPGGAVERSTWETEFPLLVKALELGVSIVPIDATIWPKAPAKPPLNVTLKTNRSNNIFVGRETIDFLVDNRTADALYVELLVIGQAVTRLVKPTKVESGLDKSLIVITPPDDEPAKEDVILFASPTLFPPYQLIGGGATRYTYDESRHIRSRIVHPFYKLEVGDSGVQLKAIPETLVRQKIVVETRR